MGSKKKMVVILASLMLVLSVSVFGVLAITAGSQTTGFNIGYAVADIYATITISGTNNGVAIEGITNATTTITSSTTSTNATTIPAQAFPPDGSGSIVFVITITNNTDSANMAFYTRLTAVLTNLTNVDVVYSLQQGDDSASDYTLATQSPAKVAFGSSHIYSITMTVHDNGLNADALGSYTLGFSTTAF